MRCHNRSVVMSRDEYLAKWSRTHGYDVASGSRFVRGWLTGAYAMSKPLAAMRLSADAVTVGGGLLAGGVALLAWAGGRWLILAGVVCVLSGIVDSLDGAVAILGGRVTSHGYVLDSLVDRVSDCVYLLALWLAGASAWLCVLVGALTFLQEYVRARATGAGMPDVGVVTVAERPTRVIVTALALIVSGIDLAHAWAQVGAIVWLALAAIGLVQLLFVVFARLRESDEAE